MQNLWKIIIRNTIIFIIIVFLMVSIILWIHNNRNSLYKTVIEKRNEWDITSLQNTMDNDEYMGILYTKDYSVDTLSDDVFTLLLINKYISQDNDFYVENDDTNSSLFSRKTSKENLEEIIKETFDSNKTHKIKEGSYGCGKKIISDKNNYIISSNDPEYCGIFSNFEERYISFISNYYKDNDDIIVKLKVGFIETISEFLENDEENDEIISYNLYEDKTKQKLLQKNYNQNCIYESTDESCYSKLPTYQIILKKNNGKYYFNKISRIN